MVDYDDIKQCLHAILVISNPCQYKRRFALAHRCIEGLKKIKYLKLYVVEVAYNNDDFFVTTPHNPNHLQLRTDSSPLWIKENMINIGIKRLFPKNWKYFAFIDADLEFENKHFAKDCLQVLSNNTYNVVQLFSHALDLDANEKPMTIFSSFGHQYVHNKNQYKVETGIHFYHPGYAYAMSRTLFDEIGSLYENSVLGSGDSNRFRVDAPLATMSPERASVIFVIT